MNDTYITQNAQVDENTQNLTSDTSSDYRLYSLIASNYCNLTNLICNLIGKTTSSKREIYQEINARLRVDEKTFNDTFNTLCNMTSGSFNNYNALVYMIIDNFISLVENLGTLARSQNTNLAINLTNNAFDAFRAFINSHPIRY